MSNPFPGGAELAYKRKKKNKKKRKKVVERNGVKCSCGVVLDFWTTISYMHDDDCIINTKKGY